MKANRSTWISIGVALAICITTLIWQRSVVSALRSQADSLQASLAGVDGTGENPRRRLGSAAAGATPSGSRATPGLQGAGDTPPAGRRSIEEILAMVPSQANGPAGVFRAMPEVLEALGDYSREELMAAVEEIDQLQAGDPSKAEVAGFTKVMLLMVVADVDPERVLEMVDGKKNAGEDQIRMMAFAGLARKDPARAREVLSGADWPSHLIQQAKSSLLGELVQADVPQALAFMRENPADIQFMSNAVIGIAARDAAVRQDLWAAMEVEADKIVREALAKGLITGEFLRGGLGATRAAFDKASFFDAELKRSIIRETAGEAIRTDPDGAFAWIRDVLAPQEVGAALARAVRSWAKKDFNAAGIWLGKQPKSPARDAAIGAFANTVVGIDPLAAVTWAAEIEDESTRQSALQTTLKHWSAKDAGAARKWMRDNGIDPASGFEEPAPGEGKE